MKSLNQIAYNYAERVHQGDNIEFIRMVKFNIKYWWATILRREVQRYAINKTYVQSYVDTLTDVDKIDSCVISSGCTVKRTTNKVPKPVILIGSEPFMYVGPVLIDTDDELPFQHSSANEIRLMGYDTVPITRYYYVNDYIYVYHNCNRKYIKIESAFEDPYEVINTCTLAINCVDDDSPLPIPNHIIQAIMAGLASEQMKMMPINHEVMIEQQ